MADDKNPQRSPEQLNNTHDPEFEMPDPDQVEKDIKQAEKLYGDDEKKKPAA